MDPKLIHNGLSLPVAARLCVAGLTAAAAFTAMITPVSGQTTAQSLGNSL